MNKVARTFSSLVIAVLLMTGAYETGGSGMASAKETSQAATVFEADPALASRYDVRILRDTWGVPHIFGKTDADAAFGLAYAHAEDDFATIQDSMIAGRSLGGSINGPDAAAIDFIVHLLGVWDDVDSKYESDLSPETRAICEAYADGINYYAGLHPDEQAISDVFPVTGKDIVVGFVFKSPFFFGLDSVILELFESERKQEVSEKTASAARIDLRTALAASREFLTGSLPTGSNTFAIGPNRTDDGSTFLAVNSHQPYTGPVAWYEAHVHSEEGWDAVGGLFPGMPVIGVGHNRDLGWAMTVNKPDLVDVYVLDINPDNPDQYLFDGEWLDFDIKTVTLSVKVSDRSDMTMKIRREVVRSVHGPVLRQKHGVYAIRYAGMGDIRQVEQWYRMNKARNQEEWLDAMRMQAIASLNVGYADKEGNILYLYNAKLPMRNRGYDYQKYLPGNTSETLWDRFLPFADLPVVSNPESGFIQNCNSTPFKTTVGPGNPDPENFDLNFGIETHMTNRALRALEVFGADESITEEEFHRYKYDMKYSQDSFMSKCVQALIEADDSGGVSNKEAMRILRNWDLSTHPDSRGAALAMMTILPNYKGAQGAVPEAQTLIDSLEMAVAQLEEGYGAIDIPWSEVNRLVRGTVDLGVGGGPDVLHAVYGRLDEETSRYIARAGDTYVMLVKWDPEGNVSSRSIHQFGSATMDESSPHYSDQSPLFVERKLKPVWMDEADIRANLESEYRPGEE